MRDINQLHPLLQVKVNELLELCKHNGISIKIGECVRTVAEQDALYAQGRSKPGAIVTNCAGATYSSMHQWGVAFDFFLNMDIDGDGQTNDDIYNNTTKIFEKVGKLGQSIGLEWGGSWKNKDLPHFQLADWGSTAKQLKNIYGTPQKFFATWTDTKVNQEQAQKKQVAAKNDYEPAEAYDKSIAGTYTITAKSGLRLRRGPSKDIITLMPKKSTVHCYGYFTQKDESWLLVTYGKYTGYCSKEYLAKK